MPCSINNGLMCVNAEKVREQAKRLYIHHGYQRKQICDELKINANTLASWIRRGKWDEVQGLQKAVAALDDRLAVLYVKNNKNETDYREIEFLERSMERHALTAAKAQAYEHHSSSDKDFKPGLKKRGRKKNREKNALTDEQIEQLEAAFIASIDQYQHQKVWYENIDKRVRNILKSRQIGATLHFAREAIVDAFLHGRNKNFISASKAQAHIFRDYMMAFVYAVTGVELKGADKIALPNGAILKFFSTNSSTAQGSTGDVYVDEYFWIKGFAKLRKLATAMASQKRWRITYISTPSTVNHPAYPFWSGESFNAGRPESEQIQLDVSHQALKNGVLCADGQWRQVVTVFDAEEKGFDLFDVEQLKLEYPGDEFDNLFLCKFIDDTASVFKLEQLQKCMVDVLETTKAGKRKRWLEFDPESTRPYGNYPVWLGYDPSRTTDAASCVVVAPPLQPGGKFRILEKHQWYSQSFEHQAAQIAALLKRFNVQKIGMDVTGIGLGVFENVKSIFPRVTPIHYSADSKTELVTKGIDIISNKRLEFDSGWTDVAKAFMTIYQTSTDNGTITYKARRTDTTGHADVAFAILHALSFEKLNKNPRKTRVSTGRKRHDRSSTGRKKQRGNDGLFRSEINQPLGDQAIQLWRTGSGIEPPRYFRLHEHLVERGVLRAASGSWRVGEVFAFNALPCIRNRRESANSDDYRGNCRPGGNHRRRSGTLHHRLPRSRQLLFAGTEKQAA